MSAVYMYIVSVTSCTTKKGAEGRGLLRGTKNGMKLLRYVAHKHVQIKTAKPRSRTRTIPRQTSAKLK